MKICKNCRHFWGWQGRNRCVRREGDALDPVSGEHGVKQNRAADDERKPDRWSSLRKKCGPDAIYFEEKLSPPLFDGGRSRK